MSGSSGVAIIIPCYKQAHLLSDALRSCLDQEPEPAEVIVVDDGSPDGVAAAVAALGDPRVRVLSRPNGGLAAARNSGLCASANPFVVFVDADDTLRPGALAAGLACHADHPDAAFVWGGYQNMDQEGRNYGPPIARHPRSEPLLELLYGNIVGMHGAVMYRREALIAAGGFDEALASVEDWDVYLRLAASHPVACHDAIVANYRRYNNTMSTDYDRMLRGGLTMLEHLRPPPHARPELMRAWRLGRMRFVGRNMRKAVIAGLLGLGRGHVRPLLRASRTVASYQRFLLPTPRPAFAYSLVVRQFVKTAATRANGMAWPDD
jgi:glycosyltransferase involved in cell wall biosynthesis